jgi:hypothetical protein
MTLTIHNIAKTYKMLPTEVLSRATTFDLYVLDTFHRYQTFMEKKNKVNKSAPIARHLTQDEMKAMIQRVKETSKKMEH